MSTFDWFCPMYVLFLFLLIWFHFLRLLILFVLFLLCSSFVVLRFWSGWLPFLITLGSIRLTHDLSCYYCLFLCDIFSQLNYSSQSLLQVLVYLIVRVVLGPWCLVFSHLSNSLWRILWFHPYSLLVRLLLASFPLLLQSDLFSGSVFVYFYL